MEPEVFIMQSSLVDQELRDVNDRSRGVSSRSIPSLDGLRAVSVFMVMVSHFKAFGRLPRHGLFHALLAVVGQGALGVTTFFVISGFLITTLLLNEMDRSGGVNLLRFYFRRCFRIFPPFYVFLVAVAVIASIQARPVPRIAWFGSAFYISNYIPYTLTKPLTSGWYVGHTWSLSVEEQFYMLWPALLVALARRRLVQACTAILVLAPLLRLASAYLLPMYHAEQQYLRLFHTTMDVLIVGCLAALWMRDPQKRSTLERILKLPIVFTACGYLAVATLLSDVLPPWYECLFGVDLTVFSIAALMLYVVLHSQGVAGRLLNLAPLRHIGIISYSLYLWQQIFFSPYRVPSSAVSFLLAFCLAELSFWTVERPTLRLRGRLERLLP